MYLSFALKIAFSNFFTEKEVFGICGLASHFLALNTQLVFLEAIKK